MSRLARLFTSVTVLAALVVGLFATTALTKAQPAYAGGNFSCSGNFVQVVCIDGPITVTLKNIASNNDIDVTLVNIKNTLNNITVLSDITTVIKIHDLLQNIGIKVCEIKIQIGLVAVNKVFC